MNRWSSHVRKILAGGFAILILAGCWPMNAGAQAKPTANAVLALDHGWKFRQALSAGEKDQGVWMTAKVPGDVHLDLLANKKIDDPFYRDNETKLQWVEKVGWDYALDFEVSAGLMTKKNIDLVFDGLDGSAQVFLNGKLLLSADNSFRVWRVLAKSALHVGKNSLWVSFPSPIPAAEEVAAKDPWRAKTKVEAKT